MSPPLPPAGPREVLAWQRTWPATEDVTHGPWRLRSAEGWTKRANSCLALPGGGDLDDLILGVEEHYRLRRIRPCMVTHEVATVEGLSARLAARQWRSALADHVLGADPRTVARSQAGTARRYRVAVVEVAHGEPPPLRWWSWRSAYARAVGGLPDVATQVLLGSPRQALAMITLDRGAVDRREPACDGEPIAVARIGLAPPWAGLNCVQVAPVARRAGLATALTRTLAGVAADHGIDTLQLAVEHGNAPARTLYGRLGFTELTRYAYHMAPAGADHAPQERADD